MKAVGITLRRAYSARLVELPIPQLDEIPNGREVLVKETWGERVKPAHSIGLLALLILLPIIILFAVPPLHQGTAEHNADLIRLGTGILLVSILTFTQVNALVNAIFGLAAYRFATARKSDLFAGDAS